jgi:hypothetical protein
VSTITGQSQFLSHFGRIFTLNYDLLLYWAVLQLYWAVLQRNLSPPAVVVKDGFGRPGGGRLTWSQPSRSDEQEIFYLHGAMHYYVDDHQVSKLEVGDGNIVSQLESNLGAVRYPLVVTEGSRDDKEARIAQSAYLTYCHRRLARLNGALFIHGMAMSETTDTAWMRSPTSQAVLTRFTSGSSAGRPRRQTVSE